MTELLRELDLGASQVALRRSEPDEAPRARRIEVVVLRQEPAVLDGLIMANGPPEAWFAIGIWK